MGDDSEFTEGMICGFVSVGIGSLLCGKYDAAASGFLAAALWAVTMLVGSLFSKESK